MAQSPQLFSRPFLAKLLAAFPTWIYGAEGAWNQARLINNGFRQAASDPEFLPFAASLLYWAWQERPLDHTLLPLLFQADAQFRGLGLLAPPQRALLQAVAKGLRSPDQAEAEQWAELVGAGVAGRAVTARFVLERAGAPATELHWLGEGFDFFLSNGWFDEARALLDAAAGAQALAPLLGRLEAEYAFHCLPTVEAQSFAAAVDPELFGWWRGVFLSTLAERAGDRATAGRLLENVVRAFPWSVNLLLKLYELTAPQPPLLLPDATRSVCALLYSWNKAEDLAVTLETLRASELGACRVVALDNGSTDATSAVFERFQQKWPHPGGFEALRLPVNIGAPAARNWLLSLPQVAACDYAAFLDDDIILPPDWLGHLLGQAVAHPEAGAVGCNIVGHLPPHAIQAADFHLLHPDGVLGGFADFEERIFVANNCIGLRDAGMFRYSRPCVSVTGCCHLLSRLSLEQAGHFDIRFAPSQFDDLDRDLRAFERGFPSFYAGRLQIRHVQHSSLSQASSRAKQAHIHGNKLKLEHLHTADQAREIVTRDQAALRKDLEMKLDYLDARTTAAPAD